VGRQVHTIRRSLLTIAKALQRLAPSLKAVTAARAGGSVPPPRKLKLSPRRRAALKLQGRYMGYLRGLRAGQKTKVKALRVTKGFGPAIALAKKLAKA
jgi:hypothetical protein